MSWQEAFGWGCVGASTGYAVVFAVPYLFASISRGHLVDVTPLRVLLLVIAIPMLVAVGGVVAIAVQPAAIKEAIITGAGAQGIVKGWLKGA
jgi:hypothetical protein